MYLALSKQNFDILRRSLAEVVHIHDVVRQEFALLHVVRVVSDLAVLCSLLLHRVKNMVSTLQCKMCGRGHENGLLLSLAVRVKCLGACVK